MVNLEQIHLFDRIQTRQTGGQPYNEGTLYGECSLDDRF